MKIKTSLGDAEVRVDESTQQTAQQDSTSGEWKKGDEVVLAEVDGFGWKWVDTKSIQSSK